MVQPALFSFLKRWNLKCKLIIFYLMFLIPMLLLNLFAYVSSTRMIQNQVTDSLAVLTGQINTMIEQKLTDIEKISSTVYSPALLDVVRRGRYIGDDSVYVKDNREMNRFFSYIVNDIDELDGVYVFTENGNMFYKSVIDQMKAVYDLERDDWYGETVARVGRPVIFGAHMPWTLQLSSNRYVYSVAKSIRGIDGSRICTLLLDLKLNSIGELVASYKKQYDSRILVLDKTNHVLFGDDLYDVGTELQEPAILTPVRGGMTQAGIRVGGKRQFLVYDTSVISGWKVIGLTEQSTIDREISGLRSLNVAVTAISSIVSLGFLLAIYLTNYKPILRLRRSMKKVEIGDFSARAEITTMDEIGSLGKSFNNMLEKINELIESEYKARLRKREAEFRALQAQINPHFLYNTLQMVSSMSVVHGLPEVDQVAKSLAGMFRYSIDNATEMVPIEKEVEHIRNYLFIQRLRLNESFDAELDIDAEAARCSILKLTLQPLVENIFVHGFRDMHKKGIVRISVKRRRSRIIVKIIDNGSGMRMGALRKLKQKLYEERNDEADVRNANIGIINVHGRLRHHFGHGYQMYFKSMDGIGTKIMLVFPAIPYEGA
ncbi:hypothetical protein AK95_04130 [Paenibacillus sp. LC231]|uniref:cache domain-containing sensor histidine kinase n=1 Tax=Paenibacillus sp. LC231 TaxID=1120679 RepID=UPI0008DC9F12|nr:sensor histidine kinase [Paenibacillus sp. LC231]OIB02106.1 hypothetical protein AK95_04130 [Paenibacillus sp. LC231]